MFVRCIKNGIGLTKNEKYFFEEIIFIRNVGMYLVVKSNNVKSFHIEHKYINKAHIYIRNLKNKNLICFKATDFDFNELRRNLVINGILE